MPIYFYCSSTDRSANNYSIYVKDAAKKDYLGMPLDDYKALLKYAKQIQKDLQRCENR